MSKLGVYLGTSSDPISNMEKELLSWGKNLSEHELEAFGSVKLPESTKNYYTKVETKDRTARLPYTKILSTYLDCREYIEKSSPDLIIQFWKYNTHAAGVSLAGRVEGIPTMSRCIGDVYNSYKEYKGLEKLGVYLLNNVINANITFRYSDVILVLGPSIRSSLETRGAPKEKLVTLPPAMHTESRFSPPNNKEKVREKLGLPKDRKIALYVGRVSQLKGMEFLVEVVKKINKETDDFLFVVVGEGQYREKFQREFDKDTVLTVGQVPYQKIHRYYQASDIYVHPSPLEGIPLTILEALECEVPVIAREAGDIDFVTDKTVNSPDKMVSAILNQDWSVEVQNKKYFTEEYQKKRLTELVEELTS